MLEQTASDHATQSHVRMAAAQAVLQSVATGGNVDQVVRRATALADSVPDKAALLATAARFVALARRQSHQRRTLSHGTPAASRASLERVADVHAHMGEHARPHVRHEAYRAVRAAVGAAPSLLQYAEAAQEDFTAPEATAGPNYGALPHADSVGVPHHPAHFIWPTELGKS